MNKTDMERVYKAVEDVLNAYDDTDEEIDRIDDMLDLCDELAIDSEEAYAIHRRVSRKIKEGWKGYGA